MARAIALCRTHSQSTVFALSIGRMTTNKTKNQTEPVLLLNVNSVGRAFGPISHLGWPAHANVAKKRLKQRPKFFIHESKQHDATTLKILLARRGLSWVKLQPPKSIIATAQLPTALTTGFSAESYTYRLAFRESSNNRPGAFVGFSPRAATRTAFLMRQLSTVNGQR